MLHWLHSWLHNVIFYAKGVMGLLKVPDVCTFSQEYFDIHDYQVSKGGDGYPSHFYTYKCYHCGKEYGI